MRTIQQFFFMGIIHCQVSLPEVTCVWFVVTEPLTCRSVPLNYQILKHMCQVSHSASVISFQIPTPGNRNKAIELCRFLQLVLFWPHGNMPPRCFIDTLVQSQSKVVKESRSGTRVSWLNRLPSLKLTFSHLKIDGWNTSFLLG